MKNIFKKSLTLSALSLALLGSFGSAIAASSTAPLQVSANINESCRVTTTPLAFGAITPAPTGKVYATATMEATCTRGTQYLINTSIGTGSSYANRSMGGTVGNTDRLSYNLYIDNGYTTISDNASGGYSKVSTGTTEPFTFYGALPLNQYVKGDNYSDNLVIILNY